MNEPDDKLLDDYLQRDSAVSQRYRELDTAELPPDLDERVLAQARNAIEPGQAENTQRLQTWRRWTVPVTLAASLVLVTTVVVELATQPNLVKSPVEQSSEPATESATNAPASQSSAATEADNLTDAATAKWNASSTALAPAALKKNSRQATTELRQAETVGTVSPPALPESVATPSTLAIAASQPMPSPPAVAAPITTAAAVGGNDAGKIQEELKPDSAALHAPVAAPTTATESALQATPQTWLEHIRALRKQGKSQQAEEEWQRFKQAWPQYPVADNDATRTK